MNSILPMLCWLLCGAICSKIARKKNRNYQTWFLLGMFFGLIALLILYFLKPLKIFKSNLKKASLSALDHFSILQEDNNYWYYLDQENKNAGPMSLKMLYNNYLKEIISNNTYVWNDTMDGWKKLQDISILKKILKKPTN
jgi:fucose 4-O-acetylase-like acetyltransferase